MSEATSVALADPHLVGSGSAWPAVRVAIDPSIHSHAAPHSTGGERHLWFGEIVELPCDLISALAGHAEYLRDLGNADEVVAHASSVARTLDKRYPFLILLR